MQEDWLKTKFVNPRDAEGAPQTEQLRYVREIFTAFGMQDPRFSGFSVVGSTMKGYGLKEGSDIDVAIFYYEKPNSGSDAWPIVTFPKDFTEFEKEYNLRRQKGAEEFTIDRFSNRKINLEDYFEINPDGTIELFKENLLKYTKIFHPLSYPIISTKNEHPVLSMKNVLGKIKVVVGELSIEEKAQLIEDILSTATPMIDRDFDKYEKRMSPTITRERYASLRIEMLKQQLKRKFGLVA